MTLREKILEKYGTVKRFAEIAGIEFNKVDFHLKEGFRESFYKSLYKIHDNRLLDGEFPRELIDQIRGQIMVKYHRQANFCKKYGFTEAYISDLLNGKYYRITPRFERVCKILDIKI